MEWVVVIGTVGVMLVLPAAIAHRIWTGKGGSPLVAVVIGLLLGWFGVIAVLLARPRSSGP